MKSSIALLLFVASLGAQTDALSYPWIYSAEAARIHLAPSHQWLNDGTMILGEQSVEGLSRGIRRLNPDTGELTPFYDFRAAARAIAKIDAAAARRATFPVDIDRAGRHALYILDGDLWVVSIADVRAIRVTTTDSIEKAPRFSPDGQRLAFVRDNDLYVFEIASGLERRVTTDGSKTLLNGTLSWVYWEEIFGRQDIGYWWSDDSTALAFLQTDESPVGTALFINHRGKYPELIEQRYPKTGTVNPKVRLGVAELSADGTTTQWVDFGDHDFEYIGRVKWLPDSSRLSVSTLNRAQNRLDLFFAARADPMAKRILVEEDDAWVNLHDDLWFIKQGAEFLWVSERTGYAHIYRYSDEGKLLGAVTKGDWAVRDSGAVFWLRQAIKAIDEKAGLVFFGALKKSSIENHVYSVPIEGGKITRLSDQDGTHTATFRPDGVYWVDEHSTARRPPSMTLNLGDGRLVVVIAPPRSDLLDDLDLVYPEFLEVPAGDDFKMPAYVYRPADFDPEKRYPIIVYGYGGPSAPSVTDSWQGEDLFNNNMLVRQGFIVACIDNRSATAISKTHENSILGQMYGDSELGDLVAGVKWLKTQSWVDPDRVGLWGWSGGGTLTLLGMTGSSEFRAGVAVAAVTSWDYYDTIWAEASMKRPQENPAGYLRTNLISKAAQLHGRLLLVHGTFDDNVHIQNAWNFVDALIEAGKTFDMMIYPMRKHGISDRAARVHLYQTMEEFWIRHLRDPEGVR